MANIFSVAISVDHIIANPLVPNPAALNPSPVFNGHEIYYSGVSLIVADYVGNHWRADYAVTPTLNNVIPIPPGTPSVLQSQSALQYRSQILPVDTDPNPYTWSVQEVAPFTVTGTGAYTGGGQIQVTKDLNAGTIAVTTPVGTGTQFLSTNDPFRANSAVNPTPLYPLGIAMFVIIPNVAPYAPEITDSQVQYHDLTARKNGVITYQLPMTTIDPGIWGATNGETDLGGSTPGTDWTEAQLGAAWQFAVDTVVGTYPAWSVENLWRLLATTPSPDHSTDMDTRRHDVVWRAGTEIRDATTLLVQRTFDNGHSWEAWTVFQDDTVTISSPTITWYNERLYVTFFDGTFIRETRSLDGGRSWTTVPTTIPFTGTNPRRVVDRTGGGAYYFFFSGMSGTDLVVAITYDNAATWIGPNTIATLVDPQQLDAEFMPDGSLVVSLFVAGVWTQYRSRDLGISWS